MARCTVSRSRLFLLAAFLCTAAVCALAGITTFGDIPLTAPLANLTRSAEYRWVVPVYASLSGVALLSFTAAAMICFCRQRGGMEVRTPLMTVVDE